MKNSLNLVLVILVFIVLGCNCQKIQDMAKEAENASKTNTSATSSPSNSSTKSDDKSGLTLDKYNQIKNGMSYKEVVDILGKEGVETMDSGSGKYRVQSFKWEGDDYKFITIVMTGDKVSSKFQANLK
ncbi:MAG: hypothetical protein WA584_14695 [Pyrinomonadaceae bacterium]